MAEMKKIRKKEESPSRYLYYVGNMLIGIALASLLVTLLPLTKAFLFPQAFVSERHQTNGLYITIPKIHAQAAIVDNVDPLNEAEYSQALKKGIAHARSTSLPGEQGTIFLFAHSSGMPWDLTWYNTIFLRLDELQIGDQITLFRDGKKFVYSVDNKKVVWPQDTSYLQEKKETRLILQTCYPIGTSFQRLLVFARPQ